MTPNDIQSSDVRLRLLRRQSLYRTLAHALVGGAVTGLLLTAVFSEEGMTGFWQVIVGTDERFLGLYLSLALSGLMLRTWRYQLIARDILPINERPTLSQLLIVTGVRNAVVDLLPARLGEGAFVYMLNRVGVNLLAATSMFGLCLVIDLVVLALLIALLIGAHLLGAGDSLSQLFGGGRAQEAAFLAGLMLFLTAVYALLTGIGLILAPLSRWLAVPRQSGWRAAVLRGAGVIIERVNADLGAVSRARSYPKLIVLTVLLRLFKYGAYYSLLLGVVWQFGLGPEQINAALATVAFVAAEASASLPVSGILGFGAYEGVWTVIFALSDISLTGGTIATIIFAVHLITQVFGYTVGAVCAFIFFLGEIFALRKRDQTSN